MRKNVELLKKLYKIKNVSKGHKACTFFFLREPKLVHLRHYYICA